MAGHESNDKSGECEATTERARDARLGSETRSRSSRDVAETFKGFLLGNSHSGICKHTHATPNKRIAIMWIYSAPPPLLVTFGACPCRCHRRRSRSGFFFAKSPSEQNDNKWEKRLKAPPVQCPVKNAEHSQDRDGARGRGKRYFLRDQRWRHGSRQRSLRHYVP